MQLRDGFASLWIERGEIETVQLTEAVNEGANTVQQACTISAAADLLAHVLAHFTDQSLRQVNAGAAGNLAEELSVICCNHNQQSFIGAGGRADLPIVGDGERIIVKVFAAGGLDDGDCKIDVSLLLQFLENSFQSLFRRVVQHFGEIVYMTASFRQPPVLRVGRRKCRERYRYRRHQRAKNKRAMID